MFKLLSNITPFLGPNDGGGDTSFSDKVLGGSRDLNEVVDFFDAPDDDDKPLDLDDKPKKTAKETLEDDDTKDDIIDDDSDDKPKKKTKDSSDKNEDEDDEEDDELKEIEKELNEDDEPTEEQLELVAPVRRREILKKYPELFKDFPYLERAYYREQQFTEVFPSIQEARQSAADTQTLAAFEKDMMSGDASKVFQAVKEESPNGFYKLVDELLPTLAKIDEKAYHHLLGNNVKHTIMAMVREAKSSNNDTLQAAAQVLHQFVFGNSDFQPPTRLSKDEKLEDTKTDELTQREMAFNRRQFDTARDGVNTRIKNSLTATIESNIDPKGSMTDYIKKTAINEVGQTLSKLIAGDKRFSQIIDKLWERSHRANYSRESQDEIRRAYLAKARTLLGPVIKKARNEALKGMGKRVREEKDDDEVKETPRKANTDRPRSKQSGDTKKIPAGMSNLEYLMSGD